MKRVLRLLSLLLLVVTIILLFPVIEEWNYFFDEHGFYTGADGILHREAQAEQNQLLLLLSGLMVFLTAFFGYKKPVAGIQPK